jgi:hypothetical protein
MHVNLSVKHYYYFSYVMTNSQLSELHVMVLKPLFVKQMFLNFFRSNVRTVRAKVDMFFLSYVFYCGASIRHKQSVYVLYVQYLEKIHE